MILETLRSHDQGGWRVRLERANYRPERRHVHVERVAPDKSGGRRGWCVGFSDDPAEADMLFAAVVRTVRILVTGESDSADWTELPEGTFL